MTPTEYYNDQARKHGLSPLMGIEDAYIREMETLLIQEAILKCSRVMESGIQYILDYGCGNGYTLERLSNLFTSSVLRGYEPNAELWRLAHNRMGNSIIIRDDELYNVIILQRVLCNQSDERSQQRIVHNCINKLQPNGILLVLEPFQRAAININDARSTLGLSVLAPHWINNYVEDNVFETWMVDAGLTELPVNTDFIGTYSYLLYVMFPYFTRYAIYAPSPQPIAVHFASLLPQSKGYSWIQFRCFQKTVGT